jgi:hypothetical protein
VSVSTLYEVIELLLLLLCGGHGFTEEEVSLIQPSASSPYPWRKINVASLEAPKEGASIRIGGF